MDFDFSDDQLALRDAVQRWVERSFSFERRHAIARAGGATREVYRELAGLGLTALAVPESHGGMGFGPVEAMVVMEELGRGLVNAPLAPAALVAPALLQSALPPARDTWLAKIADASALVVFAQQERASRYRLLDIGTRAVNTERGWALRGTKCVVPAGDEADAFVVSARVSGERADRAGTALFVVRRDAPGVVVRGYPTQDGSRAAEVHLDGALGELAVPEAAEATEFAADVGVAAACAEAVGLMDRFVELTVEYMNTRRQFGVPIASFQALRHRIADVKMQLELARSMSYFASLKLGDPPPARRMALSQAKVQLGQSMRFVGQQCVQLHGGIGITDEYVGSHYFKRLTVLEMTWGDTLHHLGEVSARLAETSRQIS